MKPARPKTEASTLTQLQNVVSGGSQKSDFVYHCCFLLFQLVKNLPPSYRFFGVGNWLRVFFARGIASFIGNDVTIETGCHFHRGLVIGDHSGIGIRCRISGPVRLGQYVMMGPEVVIHTRNHRHDRVDIPMCQQGYDEEKPVKIEDDVWLGERAIILPGVTIGKGSIVGAGAVVSKDVPPFSVVVGNPALVVKTRGESESI